MGNQQRNGMFILEEVEPGYWRILCSTHGDVLQEFKAKSISRQDRQSAYDEAVEAFGRAPRVRAARDLVLNEEKRLKALDDAKEVVASSGLKCDHCP